MSRPSSASEIANLSLRLLKCAPITSINPPDADSKVAASMAAWYDVARRETLESHPWDFATKRAELAADGTAPAFEYENRFLIPSDYVRLVRIGQDWDNPVKDYSIDGDYILANETAPLKIVYIYDIENVTKFSAKFVLALSIRLASLTAFEITGNSALAEAMDQKYMEVLSQGMSIDGQNRPTRRVQKSRLKEARQGYSRYADWRSWGDD